MLSSKLSHPAINQLMVDVLAGARLRSAERSGVDIMRNAGMAPDDWQRDFLESTDQQIILNCCRQSGKSSATAALALATATRPGALILLVAPALRQAQELFRKVMALHDAGSELPALAAVSALRAEFSNGSRIVVLPDAERTTRSFSAAALVVIDEASGVQDTTYYSLRPMLAVARSLDSRSGRIVLLSTPRGQRGFFFDVWSDDGPAWRKIQVAAPQSPRISAEFLAAERRELGDIWYRQEYFCEFLAPDSAVFDYDAIDRAASDAVTPLINSPFLAGRTLASGANFQFYGRA